MNNLNRIFRLKNLTKLNDKGLGTIEIILILVVLIALVVIFREQLLDLIATIFGAIADGSGTILS
jgi:uncharacterized MnhB-related membrane protein